MAEKTQEQLDREQYEADIKKLMSEHYGRRIMWSIIASTGMYRASFTGNSSTFFREGERNVGIRLTRDLQHLAPKEYMRMWQENVLPDDFKPVTATGKLESYLDE